MPYKDPDMRRKKHREYCRRFNARHRKERNAASRAYHAAHRDEILKRKREYNRSHKAEIRAYNMAYYAAHKSEIIVKVCKWQAENPDIVLSYIRRSCAKIRMRKTFDAAFYASCRARNRMSYARAKISGGLLYRPRFSRRIPDWATMGSGIDYASPWLVENITPSQRVYAIELLTERKAR